MTATNILKVSVLASGELFLDGTPTTLAALAQAMEQGAKEKATVWYYRENAGDNAPPMAMDVMKLIVSNKLPVRLSTKPDFSDSFPTISLEEFFAGVRKKASQGQLVIVRPDGKHLLFPALKKESAPIDGLASVEKMLPSSVKRNVAVIGDTAWTMAEKPSPQAANHAIPFFGLLMGFATIGHAVWIFDIKPAAFLNDGCREADVLIVDDARLAALPAEWQVMVAKVMRNPQILVHDRATYQLRKA